MVPSTLEEPLERGLARQASDRPSLVVWMFGLDKPNLTGRPQTWGWLPTLRFWNRIDTARHQAPLLFAGVVLVVLAHVLCTAPLVLALGPLLALAVIVPVYGALGLLPLGLFERWLRREIERRRHGG